MNLKFGRGIEPNTIKLREDVFMDCDIQSNPPIENLNWLFNDKPLNQNVSAGIIMSNLSLVVQRIKIENRGQYQCSAQNMMGKSHSNKLQLKPKC